MVQRVAVLVFLLILNESICAQAPDSIQKEAYNFNHLRVRKAGNYEVIEDTVSKTYPVNICPLASINRVEELNTIHQYAIVFCLNRFFFINKYGEMSAPFASYPEIYHPEEQLAFTRKEKMGGVGLFSMKGKEVGKLTKYKIAYPEYDTKTNECYYRFENSKKKCGLMNMKGELLLECKYADIGTISNGKCTVWKTTKEQMEVDLKKEVAKTWK